MASSYNLNPESISWRKGTLPCMFGVTRSGRRCHPWACRSTGACHRDWTASLWSTSVGVEFSLGEDQAGASRDFRGSVTRDSLGRSLEIASLEGLAKSTVSIGGAAWISLDEGASRTGTS